VDLVSTSTQTTILNQRFDGCVDILQFGWLDGLAEHSSWIFEDTECVFGFSLTLMEQFNPENEPIKGTPLDLGSGVFIQLVKEGLLNHPKHKPIADPSGSACPLIAAGLAGPYEFQVLEPAPGAIPDFLGGTEVDNILHTRHGNGAFGNIGRYYDFDISAVHFVQAVGDVAVQGR
jgi:hypothetical protein